VHSPDAWQFLAKIIIPRGAKRREEDRFFWSSDDINLLISRLKEKEYASPRMLSIGAFALLQLYSQLQQTILAVSQNNIYAMPRVPARSIDRSLSPLYKMQKPSSRR